MTEAPQFISAEEMRELLRTVYAGELEGRLLAGVARGLRHPAMPLDPVGRQRPHPLWLALLLIALLAATSFAVFTVLER
jgi:hypothetical protein